MSKSEERFINEDNDPKRNPHQENSRELLSFLWQVQEAISEYKDPFQLRDYWVEKEEYFEILKTSALETLNQLTRKQIEAGSSYQELQFLLGRLLLRKYILSSRFESFRTFTAQYAIKVPPKLSDLLNSLGKSEHPPYRAQMQLISQITDLSIRCDDELFDQILKDIRVRFLAHQPFVHVAVTTSVPETKSLIRPSITFRVASDKQRKVMTMSDIFLSGQNIDPLFKQATEEIPSAMQLNQDGLSYWYQLNLFQELVKNGEIHLDGRSAGAAIGWLIFLIEEMVILKPNILCLWGVYDAERQQFRPVYGLREKLDACQEDGIRIVVVPEVTLRKKIDPKTSFKDYAQQKGMYLIAFPEDIPISSVYPFILNKCKELELSVTLEKEADQPRGKPPAEEIVGLRPADIGNLFKDRGEELSQLRRLLYDQTAKLICIVGRKGIGKTALLSKVGSEIERGQLRLSESASGMGADGIIYVSSYGKDKLIVERLFYDFGRMLGSSHVSELMDCWQNTSIPLIDKTRFLLNKLRNGCYLLVLDNFEAVLAADNTIADDDLREFVDVCLTTPNALRLIASSCNPVEVNDKVREAQQSLLLDQLEDHDAVALLRDLDRNVALGLRNAEEELLKQAAGPCFGLPFALQKIAGILASDERLTLEQLLGNTELFDDRVVENLVNYQYSLTSDDQCRVLQALAVLNQPVPADAVRYLIEPFYPNMDVDSSLRALVSNYFVTFRRGLGTYELHPLDQKHIYAQIPDEGGDYNKRALHRRSATFYLNRAEALRADHPFEQPAVRERWVQIQWVEAMEEAVEHLFDAETWQDMIQSHKSVKDFYLSKYSWGCIWESYYLCKRMLQAVRAAGETLYVIDWLHDWAVINHRFGNYPVAIQSCNEGLELASRIEGTELLQAHLLHRLGLMMQEQGNYERARDLYEQSLRLKQKVGEPAEVASTEQALKLLEEVIV